MLELKYASTHSNWEHSTAGNMACTHIWHWLTIYWFPIYTHVNSNACLLCVQLGDLTRGIIASTGVVLYCYCTVVVGLRIDSSVVLLYICIYVRTCTYAVCITLVHVALCSKTRCVCSNEPNVWCTYVCSTPHNSQTIACTYALCSTYTYYIHTLSSMLL